MNTILNSIKIKITNYISDDSRASGPTVTIKQCRPLGRSCVFDRDSVQPSEVTIFPCCKGLTCQGLGPYEIKNGLGQAVGSDYTIYAGICTVTFDNGETQDQYNQYVNGQ